MSKGARIVCTFILALTLLAGVALAQESKSAARTAAPAAVERDNAPAAPGEAAAPAGAPAATGPAAGTPEAKPAGQPYMLILMFGAIALLWFWSSRGRKKEANRRKEMLSQLKKGDKITTIGGIIGTVVEVRDDEVMVKTDESGNVRTKFARWAIRQVGQDGKSGGPDEASK